MNERPILFSGPMVQAIISGRKTQTRRVVKVPPGHGLSWVSTDTGQQSDWLLTADSEDIDEQPRLICLPGDRLWVRETWHSCPHCGGDGYGSPTVAYRAGGWMQPSGDSDEWDNRPLAPKCAAHKWRPSIFMPRWACRLVLDVVSVRVERLQDISDEDAIAEGIERGSDFFGCETWKNYQPETENASWFPGDPTGSFRTLWDSLNAKSGYGWAANPWVWVVEFKRIEAPQ